MPGEKATVTFKANGDGNAFIVCGEDGIGTQKTTTVKAGDNTFTVEIPATMTTETYSQNDACASPSQPRQPNSHTPPMMPRPTNSNGPNDGQTLNSSRIFPIA